MKAAIVPEHGKLEIGEVDPPPVGDYDCLVKISHCAICTGTDTNIISGNFPWLTETPFILGHESAGVIQEVGPKVRNYQTGDLVTRVCGIYPGERRGGMGSNWAGFAEWGLVRDDQAAAEDRGESSDAQSKLLPGDVDPVMASLSINHREILSVTARFGFDAETRFFIVGSGYNGLLFALFAKYFDAGRVVMAGNAARAELAATTYQADAYLDYKVPGVAVKAREALGGAPTHIIDAFGSVSSMNLCRELAEPGCAFGRYGLHNFDKIEDLNQEITARTKPLNTSADELSATDLWYELYQQGFFDRPGIYDEVMDFAGITGAFDRLARREALKLVMKFAD